MLGRWKWSASKSSGTLLSSCSIPPQGAHQEQFPRNEQAVRRDLESWRETHTGAGRSRVIILLTRLGPGESHRQAMRQCRTLNSRQLVSRRPCHQHTGSEPGPRFVPSPSMELGRHHHLSFLLQVIILIEPEHRSFRSRLGISAGVHLHGRDLQVLNLSAPRFTGQRNQKPRVSQGPLGGQRQRLRVGAWFLTKTGFKPQPWHWSCWAFTSSLSVQWGHAHAPHGSGRTGWQAQWLVSLARKWLLLLGPLLKHQGSLRKCPSHESLARLKMKERWWLWNYMQGTEQSPLLTQRLLRSGQQNLSNKLWNNHRPWTLKVHLISTCGVGGVTPQSS